MNINLKGKNAIVCGSTQGIGKAIAIELATLGANITLFARNEKALKKVIRELDAAAGQTHGFLVADFRNPMEVKQAISAHVKTTSGVQILVNNSGGPAPGLAIDADPKDFLAAFSQHLICNQHIVQAVVPGMKKEKYGRIINVISTSVRTPIPNLGVSNTTRGAVASWAKTLSAELGPYGITVNNILPGLTDTKRLESLIKSIADKRGIPFEEQVNEMKNNIPARRFANPSETAALAGFLASPSAAFINGESIRVDGGATPSI
ncbi:MAG: SDR family oxidoreductase [Cyclobacteriaceae bacterium]|nr:SDR family oxidoreductase [Cyclobacteriaceae bacterium]